MNALLTVSQLNFYLKSLLESDEILRLITISGEISNFSVYQKSGHMYFTLKDSSASVKAVMFKSEADKLKFLPKDGMNVVVTARVSVFERDGIYQLYVSDITPDGLGKQMAAFLQLKEKLTREGLFSEERKRPLPRFPKKIAVATSFKAAALQDFLSIYARRFPLAEIEIYSCVMQGTESPKSVINAISYFNEKAEADFIVVLRGGGSYEDLSAFNDETLARKIFSSKIPIVSAIGHETDYTIADFVADLRAPTPSAAAELTSPDLSEISLLIESFRRSISTRVFDLTQQKKLNLQNVIKRLDIRQYFDNKMLYFDNTCKNLQNAYEKAIMNKVQDFSEKISSLRSLDPLTILSRGYSVIYKDGIENDNKGVFVKSINEINENDNLIIKMKDGEFDCVAGKKRKK